MPIKNNDVSEVSVNCVAAVALIDERISDYITRALVSASEVVDLLLDIRTELTQDKLKETE